MQNNIPLKNPGKPPGTNQQAYLRILLLTLVFWFGFQLVQMLKTRVALIIAINSQEPQIQAANKIKAMLSSVATATKQLATQGNPNAAQIVNTLSQRGINIADPNVPQQTGK